jgi:hypothetical protein
MTAAKTTSPEPRGRRKSLLSPLECLLVAADVMEASLMNFTSA